MASGPPSLDNKLTSDPTMISRIPAGVCGMPVRLDSAGGRADLRGYARAADLSQLASGGWILESGVGGDSVSTLQQALNEAGPQPPIKEDGLYGPETEAAVRRFQEQHG